MDYNPGVPSGGALRPNANGLRKALQLHVFCLERGTHGVSAHVSAIWPSRFKTGIFELLYITEGFAHTFL